MRILFLSDGGSYHTQRWVNYFALRGHRCFLITLDKGFETKAEEFLIETKLLPNFLKYPLSFFKIKRIAEKIKPDLVNAHFLPNYGFIGALLNLHPLVISTWGSDVLVSPRKSLLHRLRAEFVLRRADLVTTDAIVTAKTVCKLGVEKEKVLVTPMGVERDLIGGRKKRQKPYLLVLSNRRLEPLYDVATLLKAIPLVIGRTEREVKFIILGEGSQKSPLVGLAKKLKIKSYVEFKGVVSRESLLKYYQDSDIYVSTSLSDSTSVSLLEAMSFGLVPIVTDILGNREWIEDQKNGFLFPASDHKALADKITYLVNQFVHWKEFREKNLKLIQHEAVWEDNMRGVEERFNKMISLDRNSNLQWIKK